MHAKKFVTSIQKLTHTPYLLGRVTDDGQILKLFRACKKSRFGLKGAKSAMRFKQVQRFI